MALEIFVDTGGFHSLLVKSDAQYEPATRFVRQATERHLRFVTTDYVVDETATLLLARGHTAVADRLFRAAFDSRACRVIWMDPDRFDRARGLFVRHMAHGWSFTDCASFVVMRELHLREALTQDAHFREAGFVALLG